jgi:SAM-dependent methyltransferase
MYPAALTGQMGYSLRRYFVDEFHFRYIPSWPAGILVLDLGGNKMRKRGRFDVAQLDLKVIYVNLATVKQPDVQVDAAHIPFAGNIFGAVICAELLEHVRHPQAVLSEVYRVLGPGGVVFITVPFLYRIHGDPYDFGRYTDHYWLTLLQELGFEQITIERQGLFFAVLADFGRQYLDAVGLPRPFGPPARWLMARFTRWVLRHEAKMHVQNNPFIRSFTTGFGIVAIKRGW